MPKSRAKSSDRVDVSQSCEPETTKRYSSRHPEWLLQSFIFFTFFYLYLWLYVDLKLIYHGAGIITNFPVFYKGWPFLLPFLSYPGGPVEYLSAFLSQLFYYSWAGALVITIQAWLIYLCLDYLLKAANSSLSHLICFALPTLQLVLYTQYTYYFVTSMAFLSGLVTAYLYIKITLSCARNFSCVIVFLIMSVIIFYFAAGAFLLFAVLCAIYELFFRHRWKISLLYSLSAGAIAYILGVLIFQVNIIDAYSNLLPFTWKILNYGARKRAVTTVYVLYLLPPLTLVIFGLWRTPWKRLHFAQNQPGTKSAKKRRNHISNLPAKIFSWYRHSLKLKWAVESLLLLAVAGSIIFFSRNENLRTRFKVDYYAYHKMWPDLLMSAQQNPTDPFISHAINRALYHVGRLGYDMFSWPQHKDYLFLSGKEYKWVEWQIFDLYLDIGLVSIAENALTECLEAVGDRPMVLQRLALINMVKGNSGSAKIYLGALSKTLFNADWAKHYLDLLKTDPDFSTDKYIQHLRSLCLDKDHPTHSLSREKALSLLLEKNSQNRMAFEYLMAWYMLNKHLAKLVQKIELVRDLGYANIPTHYEEAALIYVYGTKIPLSLGDYEPNPQIRQQIEEFSRILSSYGSNKQAAANELAKKFRNTYFFYYIYAFTSPNK